MKYKDLTNQKFGRLTVKSYAGYSKNESACWNCICECGKELIVTATSLIEENTKSCGCLKLDAPNSAMRLPFGQAAFNKLYIDYKWKAKTRKLDFYLSKNEFKKITQIICFYCGAKPKQKYQPRRRNQCGFYLYNGIDRLDNTKGYTIENCVSCCKICNRMKSDSTFDEFLNACKSVIEYQKGKIMALKSVGKAYKDAGRVGGLKDHQVAGHVGSRHERPSKRLTSVASGGLDDQHEVGSGEGILGYGDSKPGRFAPLNKGAKWQPHASFGRGFNAAAHDPAGKKFGSPSKKLIGRKGGEPSVSDYKSSEHDGMPASVPIASKKRK